MLITFHRLWATRKFPRKRHLHLLRLQLLKECRFRSPSDPDQDSEHIKMTHPTVSYRVLNNPASRGPKEWQHHVPTTEDTGQIAKDVAFLVDTLDNEPFSVEEAKNRSDWPKWKEAIAYGCRNEPAQNIGNIHYCGITKRQNSYTLQMGIPY